MRKPNPLNSLWSGIKVLTVVFARYLGIFLFLLGLIFLWNIFGLWCLAVGLFCLAMSNNIASSIVKEERAAALEDDDESSNLPSGSV